MKKINDLYSFWFVNKTQIKKINITKGTKYILIKYQHNIHIYVVLSSTYEFIHDTRFYLFIYCRFDDKSNSIIDILFY